MAFWIHVQPPARILAVVASQSIAAGASQKVVTVTPFQDGVQAPRRQTVILTLAGGADYTIGTASTATVVLLGDGGYDNWRKANFTADQLAAARVRRMRMDLQRWTLAFLADTDRPFTSAGRAESPDGPADLLETTDEAGRTVHYLIDPATHLPLVVQYQQTRAAAPVVVGPRPPASPPAKLSTIAMHLSAFKQVAGVMVPHQIDIAVDGRAAEAWTIESVTINPKIKPSTFKRAVK